jgi:hypothetical protein
MSPGAAAACVTSWYNASRLSGGTSDAEGVACSARRKI